MSIRSEPNQILVNLITDGDYKTGNSLLRFNPTVKMYFTRDVLLDVNVLNNAKNELTLGKKDTLDKFTSLQSLFLDPNVLLAAIKILKDKDLKFFKNSQTDIEKIDKHNIELFRKAFFSTKEKIPVPVGQYSSTTMMSIITSEYVPDSLKAVTPKQYEIKFELFILDDKLRQLKTDEDYNKAKCKSKAKVLNNMIGSRWFDDEFPVLVKPTPSQYGMPGQYSTYGTYGIYGTPGQNVNDPSKNEVYITRQKIRDVLEKNERTNSNLEKEFNKIAWQRYKEEQANTGFPPISLDEWNTQQLKKKYGNEWLKYERDQVANGKRANFEPWIKNKLDEVKDNTIEYIRKQWENYKTAQSLNGTQAQDIDTWLKQFFAKQQQQQQQQQQQPILGGFKKYKKRSKSIRKKHSKSKNKVNKKYKTKRTRHKKSYDTSKIHPASIIL